MKVINFFGGPGSAKSTTAAGLFYHMKMEHKNVELITEYAKDLVYSDTLPVLKLQQEYVFAEQNRRQAILEGKVDWAITDSPLLLSHYYGRERNRPNQESFLKLVSDTFNMYDNINFFLERPQQFTEQGRDRTLEQSIEIDNALIKILEDEKAKYIRVAVDDCTIITILKHLQLA